MTNKYLVIIATILTAITYTNSHDLGIAFNTVPQSDVNEYIIRAANSQSWTDFDLDGTMQWNEFPSWMPCRIVQVSEFPSTCPDPAIEDFDPLTPDIDDDIGCSDTGEIIVNIMENDCVATGDIYAVWARDQGGLESPTASPIVPIPVACFESTCDPLMCGGLADTCANVWQQKGYEDEQQCMIIEGCVTDCPDGCERACFLGGPIYVGHMSGENSIPICQLP